METISSVVRFIKRSDKPYAVIYGVGLMKGLTSLVVHLSLGA